MTDAIVKENFSKNAAADATRGDANEAMSKFASELYKKHEDPDESKSKLSKELDDKFKYSVHKDASTAGDGSSAEKCLPNLKFFDSGESFDATPNTSELKKNPALDSQKDSPSKYPHMLKPESAEIPHVNSFEK